MSQVDVLVITALPLEFESARAVSGDDVTWHEHDRHGPESYISAELELADRRLTVALARPTAMSGRSTGPIATALVKSLRPRCLAMSGVCAGNPADTAPGDVLIAAPAFQYDEGKQRGDEFLGDVQQFPLEDWWLRAVQSYDPAHLPSYGLATEDETITWLLERLLLDQDPRTHPARRRYFPGGIWAPCLAQMEDGGLIVRQPNGQLALTVAGRDRIERTRYDDVDGPERLPFAVMAGPLASGNAVMQDPAVWERLRRMGTRRILGLDMEAATLATIAHQREVPHWLIAKGVMDAAELQRGDRFKKFAARASAEVLFDLLGMLLEPAEGRRRSDEHPGSDWAPTASVAVTVPGQIKVEISRRLLYDWPDLADHVGIPAFERVRFGQGEGPRSVWEWLEVRGRLGELPGALVAIGRDDLAALLRHYLH